MANIKELLSSGKVFEDNVFQVAKVKCAVSTLSNAAYAAYTKNGNGYIYTPSGFCMPDTPRLRSRMVALFKKCVIITADGEPLTLTKFGVHRMREVEHTREVLCERREERREEAAIRNSQRLLHRFHSDNNSGCRKRQGKANRRSDIGRYVDFGKYEIL